jgi:hypothetical protein
MDELDELVLEHFEPFFDTLTEDQLLFVLESEEYITEERAVKQKVVRELMLTIRYGKCKPGFKVDSATKQCVRMSTAEQKLYHKLAKHSAKMFKKQGTAAQAIKSRKYAKSMTMRQRLGLKDVSSKKN